jgi:CBS domain-containing protein
MTVERILKAKGSHTPTVVPDARIADVITALEAEDVGALVVSADGQRIDGIISERDVVRGLQRFGPEVLNHSVCDLMSSDVVTCMADDRIAGVMAVMDDRKIRHLPVVDDGKLAGVVSIRDIIKHRLDEVQAEADAMRSYIAG